MTEALMREMLSSRVRFLKTMLKTLGFHNALKALDLMIQEMCAEKGFKRHNGAQHMTSLSIGFN